MTLDETILNKIRNYGALKYRPRRIVELLGLNSEEQAFIVRELEDPDSIAYRYYRQGVKIGEYNVDAELAKNAEKGDILSIQELSDRQHKREMDDLKRELFGI